MLQKKKEQEKKEEEEKENKEMEISRLALNENKPRKKEQIIAKNGKPFKITISLYKDRKNSKH